MSEQFKLGGDSGLVLIYSIYQDWVKRRSDTEIVFNNSSEESAFNDEIISCAKKIISRNKELITTNPYGEIEDSIVELRVEYEDNEDFIAYAKKINIVDVTNETYKLYIALAGRLINQIQQGAN